MPVNKKYNLAEVLRAGDFYAERTGRRVTYEYTLLAGVNDREEHALKLAGLLQGRLANVNLIPVNPAQESGFKRPRAQEAANFARVLQKRGINFTFRKEMGQEIAAACGQLKYRIQSAAGEHSSPLL